MRFVAVYRTVETGTPPAAEQMAAMGAFIEEITKAGVLIGTGGCLPSAKGARIRSTNGTITVTDGPFTESKEVVAGYAIFEVGSKEEAIEWTRRFIAVAGDGESEIRQLHEPQDFGDQAPEAAQSEQRGATAKAGRR